MNDLGQQLVACGEKLAYYGRLMINKPDQFQFAGVFATIADTFRHLQEYMTRQQDIFSGPHHIG